MTLWMLSNVGWVPRALFGFMALWLPFGALLAQLALFGAFYRQMGSLQRAWALSSILATSTLMAGMLTLAYITLRDVSVFYGTPR